MHGYLIATYGTDSSGGAQQRSLPQPALVGRPVPTEGAANTPSFRTQTLRDRARLQFYFHSYHRLILLLCCYYCCGMTVELLAFVVIS